MIEDTKSNDNKIEAKRKSAFRATNEKLAIFGKVGENCKDWHRAVPERIVVEPRETIAIWKPNQKGIFVWPMRN